MQMAQELNLLHKASWIENPSRMRRNRALIDALRQAFPEFVVGVVIQDELKDGLYTKTKNFVKRLSAKKNSLIEIIKKTNFTIKKKPAPVPVISYNKELKASNSKALPSCSDDCFETKSWFNSKIN